jgi:crotonobetainyl-CoA:carnitine CoA-transferase CaiB-like acyl-CoA transferase
MLCGKILGDLGADVIKVEPSGGDPSRNIPPFYHDIPDREKSLFWYGFNTSKRGIALDLENKDGRDKFRNLVERSDFVVESFPPGYMDSLGLGYSRLSQINPRIIVTSITPFGQTGPYKDYKGSDIEVMAMSGLMYLCGDPDRPPVRCSFPLSYIFAGAEAAVGAMLAHYYREKTGQGQHVDVSMQESLFCTLMWAVQYWEFENLLERRAGPSRRGIGGMGGGRALQRLLWPCKDGHIAFVLYGGGLGWVSKLVVDCMDEEGMAPDFLKNMDWKTLDMGTASQEYLDRLIAPMGEFFLAHTKEELYRMAVENGTMLYPVTTADDMLRDPQLQFRNFWINMEHPELETAITYPGPFVELSETPCSIQRRAPRIGEHNEEIVEKLSSGFEAGAGSSSAGQKVLDGVKVVDFTWVAAGPMITKYLAEHGAEVIRIESSTHPDLLRAAGPYKDGVRGPNRATHWASHNNDKYGITLNITKPEGIEIAKRLISRADIVVENFTPGAMARRGMSYEELRKINDNIVMLSASIQGQTGPYYSHPGTGLQLGSLAGLTALTGWPDREPAQIYGAVTDAIGACLGTAALVAALAYRDRTGRGQYLDLSQNEASIYCIAPVILDYTVNGRVAGKEGNRCPYAAPHSAYPCQGEDRWCAIAIFTDEEWQRFCLAIGNPAWAKDLKFSTLTGRKANEDELDRLVADWTVNFTAEEVMAKMQVAGIGAGVVQTIEDLYRDPQLEHRHHFWPLKHPEIGKQKYRAPGFRLSLTPTELRQAAPCIGEHNEYIYNKILGITDGDFVQLMASGVFD